MIFFSIFSIVFKKYLLLFSGSLIKIETAGNSDPGAVFTYNCGNGIQALPVRGAARSSLTEAKKVRRR